MGYGQGGFNHFGGDGLNRLGIVLVWQVLVDFVGLVVCCDGGVVVVVQWVWYGLFGRFSVVCCMNGGGSWCFAGSVVVVQMYELWVILAGSSGEEEELFGRIERWDRREK